ncbi:hypothetical protein AGMMS49957_15350 [Synergistales bacterium]|nr:hypothetical protein AGMMS49957_15350 [Synergistales bacterium]
MILKKLVYSEFEGQPNYWELTELALERINLLVGKNATGKTNTINRILWLANLLGGVQPFMFNSCNYRIELSDDNDTYVYTLRISLQKVVEEKLTINGEEKFSRSNNGEGKIFAERLGSMLDFQVPTNQLVAVARRDKIQHSYLDKLFEWAEGLRFYAFGSPLGKDSGFATTSIEQLVADPHDSNQVAALFAKGKQEYLDEFNNKILEYMKIIGYELTAVDVAPNPHIQLPIPNGTLNMIYVIENGREMPLFQPDISQGMFRALSLIIQLVYNTRKQLPTTILIDDIGEGLDFDRSTSLINLLSSVAETNEIQLIMSTNDRFVMNNVPLENWQVIQRDGGVCSVHNYANSKDKFEEFRYTGLSNFDLLTSDFLSEAR